MPEQPPPKQSRPVLVRPFRTEPAAPGPLDTRPTRPGSGVSLELRLVGIIVLAVAVATTVVGAALVLVQRQQLLDQVNSQLLRTGPGLAQATAENIQAPLPPGRSTSYVAALPSEYVVVVYVEAFESTVEFQPQFRSQQGTPDIPVITGDRAAALNREPFTVGARDGGGRWQVLSLPAADRNASVSVALPLDADGSTKRLALVTLLIGTSVVISAALLGVVAVRRSLRPLADVEQTAVAIARGDLTARVPEGGQDTEVGRLTTALNGMLTRIEDSIRQRDASQDRMRRFVADASHELRTPLASIRGFAELHRQGAVPAEQVPATFTRIEGEARRLGVLVEDLLLLARLDEQRPLRRVPVDLAALVLDAGGDVRALDPTRPVRVAALDGRPVTPVAVEGDPDRLRQVLTNLVGNAIRHTAAGTPVDLAVGRVQVGDGAAVVLEVRDHGQGVPDADKARVFDRFARLDASRTRDTGGAGLGLSIVAAVVHGHGGEVSVLDTPGGGATFRIVLPAPSDAPAERAEDLIGP
ncbi:ATP-binding protein [Jannaschia sp. R86511]|uniref:sensor histidine kinase n=1 Tax=Jannaschia sp. R86511 TaxID=3093853 RepID=UPI0036D4329B